MKIRRPGILLCAVFAIAVATTAACGPKHDSDDSILPPSASLREGDIVFRRGLGMTSRIVTAADRRGHYSHVGIAARLGDSLMIIHAVPDEPDFPGDVDRVKADTPARFFARSRALVGEICRPLDSVAARRAARHAVRLHSRAVAFDHSYDDADTSRLYCCQLVDHVFRHAGVELTDGSRHSLRIPGLVDVCCLLPSDLCNSPRLRSVARF